MNFFPRNKIPLAIIFAAIIIGVFIYFSNRTTISTSTQPTNSTTPTVSEETTTTTPILTPTPTKIESSAVDEIPLIQSAVAAKLGKNLNQIDVNISQLEGTYVKGNVKDKGSETGGGYFIATKVNGSWIIVYDGQSTPTCQQLSPYNFPTLMVPECLNAGGQIVKR